MKRVIQKIKKTKAWAAKKRRDFLEGRVHRSFRKSRTPLKRLAMAGIRQNMFGTFKTIWQERRILWWLGFVYMAVTYIFVGGIAQADFVQLKQATLDVLGGSLSSLGTAVSLLTSTMTGAFTTEVSELQQFLAIVVALFFWLSIVWALRMRFADEKITARDALYSAGSPVVATVVVGFFIILQLTPGAVGLFVFNLAQAGGYLHAGIEAMLFATAAALLCCLSVYWLASSLTALVVVTLPHMYPWRAMQIASRLAIGRRLRLTGHLLALAVLLFLLWAACLLPVLLLDGWLRFDWLPLIPVVVQLLSAFTLLYVAAYVYKLYRSML